MEIIYWRVYMSRDKQNGLKIENKKGIDDKGSPILKTDVEQAIRDMKINTHWWTTNRTFKCLHEEGIEETVAV